MLKHYLITSCNASTKIFTSQVYNEETILQSDYAPAIQELKVGESESWVEQIENWFAYPKRETQNYIITITRIN